MILSNKAMEAFLALVAFSATADAFSTVRLAGSRISQASPFQATTLEPPTATEGPTTWECDEDAECVEVPACDDEGCRTSLDVRIHGEWYDLTG